MKTVGKFEFKNVTHIARFWQAYLSPFLTNNSVAIGAIAPVSALNRGIMCRAECAFPPTPRPPLLRNVANAWELNALCAGRGEGGRGCGRDLIYRKFRSLKRTPFLSTPSLKSPPPQPPLLQKPRSHDQHGNWTAKLKICMQRP